MTELAAVGMSTVRACELVGIPRSSFYRLSRGYRHYRAVVDPVPHRDRHQPAALTAAERGVVVEVLTDAQYLDVSVVQTYWRAFDAGRLSCSLATFCRIARAERLTGDRRRTRRGGSQRPVPTAVASRPNQLWSWDATELSGGPDGQERYQLMLILDVYSRFPVGWAIEPTVTGRAATTLFTAAFARHGTAETVHADNGSAMGRVRWSV